MTAHQKIRQHNRPARHAAGVTLVEMLVAVVIVIILVSAGIAGMKIADNAARRGETYMTLNTLENIHTEYKATVGSPLVATSMRDAVIQLRDLKACRDMIDGMGTEVVQIELSGSTVTSAVIYDGWRNEISYKIPSDEPAYFVSPGADGKIDTSDDIKSTDVD